jgi:hypothetical protein
MAQTDRVLKGWHGHCLEQRDKGRFAVAQTQETIIMQHPGLDAWPPGAAHVTAPSRRPWFSSISWLLAWEQRRSAARCCRQMLALHAQVGAEYPGFTGLALYRLIVAARLGASVQAADTVLLHAEQSYSIWPVDRELRFRDVVHYLAVTEFAAEHGDLPWLAETTKAIVNEVIPHGL